MARHALKPNPANCSLGELDAAIRAARGLPGQMRMLALKTLLLGVAHDVVAQIHNVERATLLIWIKAFNAQGIDGLIGRERPGRPRKIGAEHTERLCDLIDHPGKAEIEHWTAKKFHGHLRDELQIECGYRTVVRWLHEHGYRLKVPQPWPDRQDEEARKHWLEMLRGLLADSEIDLWYMDEMGVEGDPRPRRRWARVGEKTRATKNGGHLRMNVTGMICPRTGEAFMLEFSHNDREFFQAFLDEANRHVATERRRNLLVCDNASWHKCKSNAWGKFEPLFLPAYSPDFNPIERLWLLIKAEWFSDFVAKDRIALIDRLDKALVWVMNRQNDNKNTCAIR